MDGSESFICWATAKRLDPSDTEERRAAELIITEEESKKTTIAIWNAKERNDQLSALRDLS